MPISSSNLTPGMQAAMKREPAPLVGSAKSVETAKEKPSDACALGEEIKGLHEPFKQWCRLRNILYVHANPTKKATIQKGQADFVLLANGCGAAVEFKALDDVESGLSQEQKDWRDWAERCGVSCLVTNSLAEAIKFATRELELNQPLQK